MIAFQIGIVSFSFAQHYVFIEAEGQQPFYLKTGGETYSSSASGFIILSKLNKTEIDFIIGFPNKLYPEVAFKLNAVAQDKGFALRQMEGKGWVLVDRLSAVVVTGGAVDTRQPSSPPVSNTSGFAELLADATGDKSLLEKMTVIGVANDKTSNAVVKPKTNSSALKTQSPAKQPGKTGGLGIVRSYIQSEDSSLLRIAYFEKGAKNNWDTILVEIEKIVKDNIPMKPAQVESTPITSSSLKVIVGETIVDAPKQSITDDQQMTCTQPIALPKDLRELQRKMTKEASIERQLELAMKTFSDKCFTTKQVKELGVIFWEEQNRLVFYTRVRKYVSDPSLYSELEQSFLQEGSRKAFREMLKNQQL